MSNIFDLENLGDLPAETRDQIIFGRRDGITKKILSLFDIKPNLTKDEIIVGMYRKYQIKIKRDNLSCTLYNLCREDRKFLIKENDAINSYRKYNS